MHQVCVKPGLGIATDTVAKATNFFTFATKKFMTIVKS